MKCNSLKELLNFNNISHIKFRKKAKTHTRVLTQNGRVLKLVFSFWNYDYHNKYKNSPNNKNSYHTTENRLAECTVFLTDNKKFTRAISLATIKEIEEIALFYKFS